MFKVAVVARDPKAEERMTPLVEAIVDTGAELTCLPGEVLRFLGPDAAA